MKPIPSIFCVPLLAVSLAAIPPNVDAASVTGVATAKLGSFSAFPNYPSGFSPGSFPGGFSFQGDEALNFHNGTADFQQIFTVNTPPEPRLGVLAQAIVGGEIGRLTGFATTEMKGFPFGNVDRVTATTAALVLDSFVVKSGSLPVGSPVALRFDMDVGGDGVFAADYRVTQIGAANGGFPNGPPKNLVLQLSGFAGAAGGHKDGVIQALVGEQYTLEYGLKVVATTSTFGLNGGTKFSVSDYSHTSHYFAQPLDANVFLATDSSHDYTRPAVVPLPASGVLLLSALGVFVRRRAGRGSPDEGIAG